MTFFSPIVPGSVPSDPRLLDPRLMSPADQAALRSAVAEGLAGVALEVASFAIPNEIPPLNALLATGRWDILHVTDANIMVKRVLPDPEDPKPTEDGAYAGPGQPVLIDEGGSSKKDASTPPDEQEKEDPSRKTETRE